MLRIVALLIAIIIVLVGAVIYFARPFSGRVPFSSAGGVAGVIKLNGPIPVNSSIALAAKKANTNDSYQFFTNNLPATDEVAWNYQQADNDQAYEIQAYLQQSGQNIATSDPLTVTAPAHNEEVVINYQSATAGSSNAVLAGTVTVNGYIPTGSTIQILGRKSGNTTFEPVITNLPAQATQYISYATAVSGQLYDVQAQLIGSTGLNLGQSGVITLSAPTNNAVLQINSGAVPPPPAPSATLISAGISGSINLNGTAPNNSSIVVLARPSGTSNYNVVLNGMQPIDQNSWQWLGAQAGQSYDLQAVLKQQNSNGTQTDVAASNQITVTAPATNQVFTINSSYQLGGPNGNISVSCGVHNSAQNNWTASVNFGSVVGAQSYWFQVGTTSGGSDLVNTQLNSTNNPNQTINVTLNDSVSYYARYAYANVQSNNWSNFSLFSNVTTIHCP